MNPSTSPRCSPVGTLDVQAVEVDDVVVEMLGVHIPQPGKRSIHRCLQFCAVRAQGTGARCAADRLRVISWSACSIDWLRTLQRDLAHCRPTLRRAVASRPRPDPRSLQVESQAISFPTGTRGSAAYDELDRQDRRRSPRCRARWPAAATQLLARAASCATRSASSNTRCGTSRRSGTTRISATTRSTRKRQQVQILFAKAAQASAWFDPELLKIPLDDRAASGWRQTPALAVYRFAIEDLYRQQEHVLDDKGEHLLSLSSRFSSSPNDAYAALSTADVKHPTIRLSNGAEVTLTYGQYRAILATNRNQADRAAGVPRVPQDLRGATSTPTRRSTTACCSATGSTRRRAATSRRSTRRCTATTFRPPSSKT